MTRIPAPKDDYILGLAQMEPLNAAYEQVTNGQIESSHSTLTIEDDKPSPGGDANGLWKGCPETPLTKWGIALTRKAPPKT